MTEQRTIASIIEKLQEWVTKKIPISPHVWVEAAADINILRGDETDKYWELFQKVALKKVELLNTPLPNGLKCSVAHAKAIVESTHEYKELKRQEAFLGLIEEMIRIAKIRSRLAMDEIKGN